MDLKRISSNVSNKTAEAKKITVNPRKLKGVRDELFKLSVRGQQVNTKSGNGSGGNERSKSSDHVIAKMEGLQIDKND